MPPAEVDRVSITTVVDNYVDLVPQHCTGLETIATLYHRMPTQTVMSSVGTTFTFAAPGSTP
jgi:metal-dependent hydrolase (beta-lactamase superfamily II)